MFGVRATVAALAACAQMATAAAATVAQDQAAVTATAAIAMRELAPAAGTPARTPGALSFMPTDTAAYDPSQDPPPGMYLLVTFDGRIASGAMLIAPRRTTRGGLAPGLRCTQC